LEALERERPGVEGEKKWEDERTFLLEQLSRTLLRLGDHGLESRNFSQGMEDYEACRKIRESIFKETAPRKLADVYAQLACIHRYAADEAAELNIMYHRIEALKFSILTARAMRRFSTRHLEENLPPRKG